MCTLPRLPHAHFDAKFSTSRSKIKMIDSPRHVSVYVSPTSIPPSQENPPALQIPTLRLPKQAADKRMTKLCFPGRQAGRMPASILRAGCYHHSVIQTDRGRSEKSIHVCHLGSIGLMNPVKHLRSSIRVHPFRTI